MEQELLSLLNEDNVKLLAKEIIDEMVEFGDEKNIEIDYQLSGGKMISRDINTIFFYNSKENTLLRVLVEKAQKIEDISYDAHDKLLQFEKSLEKEMNEKYKEIIKNKIRQFTPLDHKQISILTPEARNKILETIFPMNMSYVVSCILNLLYAPDGDGGYTVKVEKNSPRGSISTQSVANDLIKRNAETGKNYDEIIKEQKELGNEQYKYVMRAEKKYYDSQCMVSMCINFNPAPKEEVEKVLKNL